MLSHWIWFATRKGLTDHARLELLAQFHDPEELYYADPETVRRMAELSPEAFASLGERELAGAEAVLEQCDRKRIQILTFQDALYPKRLKNTADPPCVLYYKGRLPELDAMPVIGVVGTRSASGYGLTVAKRMGYQIGQCGGIVVSGMALGIDALAMSGALTAGAPVVGVLGCGVDLVYPAANRGLYADLERYGCILSELPPGTPPSKWAFPRRNRIISGVSNGVLVVEAPQKSGALITARLAAEQGRDVFAVPGNIDVPSCAGSNALLREGAIAATTGWEVLCEYGNLYPGKLRNRQTSARMTAYPDEVRVAAEEAQTVKPEEKTEHIKKNLDKKMIDKEPSAPYSDRKDPLPPLSEEERLIVHALQSGERQADDVIAETGLTTGKFLAAMTVLEIKGILHRLPGKRLRLAGQSNQSGNGE